MLKITRYGYTEKDEERGSEADAILYVPHAAQGQDFAELDRSLWQRIVNASPASEQELRDLITIESDIYSEKFAHQVARLVKKIYEELKKVKLKIVEVLVPRAVIDINRAEHCAVWELFDHKEFPDLLQELRNLRANIMDELVPMFTDQAIMWEVHTMSPRKVTTDKHVTPTTIQERINEWAKPRGPRVVNDLVCKREGSDTVSVGDPVSVRMIFEFFQRFGVDITLSERYKLSSDHMSGSWYDEHGVKSSTIIDITKDHTCKEDPDSEDFDLRKLSYSERKLARIAGPYATALAAQIGRVAKDNYYRSLGAIKSTEI